MEFMWATHMGVKGMVSATREMMEIKFIRKINLSNDGNGRIRALKTHKLISQEHELETILRDIKENDLETEESFKSELKDLLEEPNASKQVKFLVLEKVATTELNRNTGKQKQATTQRIPKVLKAKDLIVELLTDYQDLKDHLERSNIIKEHVKVKREEAVDSDDKVMLQVERNERMEKLSIQGKFKVHSLEEEQSTTFTLDMNILAKTLEDL